MAEVRWPSTPPWFNLETMSPGVAGDVTDPAHRASLVAAVGSSLDLLINNASELGPSPLQTLAQISPGDVARIFDVNVLAPLALTQALMPPLVSRAGVIVNISSDAAVEAYPGWGAYGASKAAFDHLSAVLAEENPRLVDLRIRSGRYADGHASGSFPRRRHLRPATPRDGHPGARSTRR